MLKWKRSTKSKKKKKKKKKKSKSWFQKYIIIDTEQKIFTPIVMSENERTSGES